MATAMAAQQQLRISYPSMRSRFSILSLFSSSKPSATLRRSPALPVSAVLRFAIGAIPLSLPSLPSLPSILEGIWEGILKAVPKKKTSHMKRRHRQMAGKGLKDVTSLCKCPACGNTKRMHYLCPHCMQKIKRAMNADTNAETTADTKS